MYCSIVDMDEEALEDVVREYFHKQSISLESNKDM
jgi:predicted transposase YbfD/YdcC